MGVLNDTNERQKKALADSEGKKSVMISWRDTRVWATTHLRDTQLTRNPKPVSKSLAKVPAQALMRPFARLALDSIAISCSRNTDGEWKGLDARPGFAAIVDVFN